MAEIQIKNVEKWFGSYQALKSIDLTISDQEFMVLLGRLDVARPHFCGSLRG